MNMNKEKELIDEVEVDANASDEPSPPEETETVDDPSEDSEPVPVEEKTELEEALAQAAEYLDGWQRTQAEFANYRKRQEAARQQQTQMSNANLMAKILPIIDDLDRALNTLPPGIQGLTWLDGVLLIKRKLDTVLESEGVTPIDTQGQSFDPRYHEAVTYEEVQGFQDGQIVGEMQRGYVLGDRVIRPALVRVARAPSEPAPPEPDADDVEGSEQE
jgi:molecular chaperone GrpE